MKRFLCLTLCLIFCLSFFSVHAAAEISEEDFDAWYDDITYMVEEIGIRKMNQEGQQTAREWLIGRFRELGYSSENGTLNTYPVTVRMVPQELIDMGYKDEAAVAAYGQEYTSASIEAIRPAKNENAPILIMSAHYDSNSPGARDNASGMATILLFAEKYAAIPVFDNTELRFLAFTAEETGHQGSMGYVDSLSESEKKRILAVWNVDILFVDVWETTLCLSCDAMGGRTTDGYQTAETDIPVWNRASKAFYQAMNDTGLMDPAGYEDTWCGLRVKDASDHESFHYAEVDAVNIAFRGNTESGGCWPEFMHTVSDIMGDFDLERSMDALTILDTMLECMCMDHGYGNEMGQEMLESILTGAE